MAPCWHDSGRVARAAVRHDMEEILQTRIDRAYRAYCVAVNAKESKRAVAQALLRVTKLRALLARTEDLSTS